MESERRVKCDKPVRKKKQTRNGGVNLESAQMSVLCRKKQERDRQETEKISVMKRNVCRQQAAGRFPSVIEKGKTKRQRNF